MKKYCDDCGCKVYNGLCQNCHEVNYIERQYHDLDMPVPQKIYEEARENERKVKRKTREE